MRMEATATKDNWKPTSNNHIGWTSSMKKAVAASVLTETAFSCCRWERVRMENMQTERTTEGDSPVRNAKPHRRRTMKVSNGSFSRRQRFQRGGISNQNKAYRKPM